MFSVVTAPTRIAFTRISGANSIAIMRVICSSAAFAPPYGIDPMFAAREKPEETFTTAPSPRARMCGATARER